MALIKCPDCEKEFSDSAKKCPNCGYKYKKPLNINYSSIGGWILTVVGLGLAAWMTIWELVYYDLVYFDTGLYIVPLFFGLVTFIIGCFLLTKQYGKKINKISYMVGGIILLINLIIAPIGYHAAAAKYAEDVREFDNQNSVSTESSEEKSEKVAEDINPDTSDYYIGTWEYTQPNNQDGVKSVKLVVNPDKTVQALVNVNGNEIVVYGSWFFSTSKAIWMEFNDTEEHINGILYVDHLRIFKGYNDYFGIKFGQIKNDNGKTYLYEDSSDADAKNPNKRVELTKIK